ncbi:type IV pili sensor histidine kinase and response regulator [Pseudomonas asplenii]|uniref:Type IV pili sensor histidine kinase and response regulator n=1 Tax=Pseudomonas asplenii TaxID=53407 RepID=A0A1H6NST8_9PSED|nr:pilus assembly protein [Pseudomonas fuscovaginae]SEI19475.1 type IV pili sensor histidine kinase and response regulator [Pseudomonas fuscovaginae]
MHHSPTRPLAALVTLALPLTAIALSGCVSPEPSPAPAVPGLATVTRLPVSSKPHPLLPERSPPLRTGRYTLTNTLPRTDQLDLLQQVIEIRIPDHLNPNVQDAMTHVLRQSGYRLCTAPEGVQVLYAHPLPAAHYHLGPVTLGNALLALAGPAWQVGVDERARRICFSATQLAGDPR